MTLKNQLLTFTRDINSWFILEVESISRYGAFLKSTIKVIITIMQMFSLVVNWICIRRLTFNSVDVVKIRH
ncbi:hypothetical protein BH11BAC3_BH11BAC3_08430 [soil metagenome]